MNSPGAPRDWLRAELDGIRAAGRWRQPRSFDAYGPTGMLDERQVTSFASNDYLGLSTHPAVLAAAGDALQRWGSSATASRLIVGSRPVHEELEAELADWKGTQRALAFSSGFTANLGVLTVLGGSDCLVVSDELNHASIIDGCRLSKSQVAVARHNDVDHVRSLLAGRQTERAVVAVDAVFSMDGDAAPVAALAECCRQHGAVLVLDEAHAVFGPDIAALAGDEELELVRVVTLSKTLGSMGGAVCGSTALVDLLINRARPFIFSTGLSPADTAAALAAVRIVRSEEGTARITHLRALVDRLQAGHPSAVVPILVGEEEPTMAAAEALLQQGILVPGIRPPTVPPGTSRLRVALSASHTHEMLEQLLEALQRLGLQP